MTCNFTVKSFNQTKDQFIYCYSLLSLNIVAMGHVPDQEKGEQRTLQRIFWPKDPSEEVPKEDLDSLGTPWIQQVADDGYKRTYN